MSARDLGGVPTFGLHSATWRNIRKALRRLGAEHLPETNNHDSMLMRLPSGGRIPVGKPNCANEQVRAAGLQQLLNDARTAGLDPLLLAAVLDGVGCAWVKRPPEVANLRDFLRKNALSVNGPNAWRRALTAFEQRERSDGAAIAAAPEEAPVPEPTPAETFTHPLTLLDVVDSAGVPEAARRRAAAYLRNGLKGHRADALLTGLVENGRVIFTAHPRFPSRREARFTDSAALVAAELLVREFLPTETPAPPTPTPTPEPESAANESAPPAAASSPTPDAPHAEIEEGNPASMSIAGVHTVIVREAPDTSAPRMPRNAPATPIAGVGQSLTLLCFLRGLLPAFYEDDREAIDIVATIQLLANDALADARN